MTIEEAIFCERSYIGETNCIDCKYYGTETCQSRESHKMAVKALEQQLKMGNNLINVDRLKKKIQSYQSIHDSYCENVAKGDFWAGHTSDHYDICSGKYVLDIRLNNGRKIYPRICLYFPFYFSSFKLKILKTI